MITEDRVLCFFFYLVLFCLSCHQNGPNSGSRVLCNRSSAVIIWFLKLEFYLCSLLPQQMKRNAAWLTEHSRLAQQIGSNIPYHFSSPSMILSSQLQFNESSIWRSLGCKSKVSALIDAAFPVYLDPGLKGLLNKACLSSSHLFCSVAYDTLTHTTKCLTNDRGSQRKLHKWKGWFITLCNSGDIFSTLLSHFCRLWLFSSAAVLSPPGLQARHFYHLKYVIS